MSDQTQMDEAAAKNYAEYDCHSYGDDRELAEEAFLAGIAHERKRAAELVSFLANIAPSWLPEGVRAERRELLARYRGEK